MFIDWVDYLVRYICKGSSSFVWNIIHRGYQSHKDTFRMIGALWYPWADLTIILSGEHTVRPCVGSYIGLTMLSGEF